MRRAAPVRADRANAPAWIDDHGIRSGLGNAARSRASQRQNTQIQCTGDCCCHGIPRNTRWMSAYHPPTARRTTRDFLVSGLAAFRMCPVIDPHDLQRFIDAQASQYGAALAELRTGEKRSHWMWFIFPQLRGLGSSRNAELYGVASLVEARAYLRVPFIRRTPARMRARSAASAWSQRGGDSGVHRRHEISFLPYAVSKGGSSRTAVLKGTGPVFRRHR